jgi:adenylate cyclase
MTRLKIAILVLVAFVLIIAIGIFLARRITAPLLRVVHASAQVARGDFNVTVKPVGTDELAALARTFNYMVARLREGLIYRDLLGRTLSPEVRDQFRQSLASGNLRLEGQNIVATILMSDIRGFTPLSEKTDPITVWAWLNEYFGELVPIITAHGGVVSEYIGDALLVFFGILPTPQPPEESASRACQTALAMLTAIDQINARRIERGEPPLITGIGVNTGLVTAGSIGTADRMRYGVVGDTVNTTQRLESFTRQFGTSSIVVSAATVDALQQRQGEFLFEDLGAHQFKGKSAPFAVYRLHPTVPVISPVTQEVETE